MRRPDPGRDEGGSWLFVAVFMAAVIALAVWWVLLMVGAANN